MNACPERTYICPFHPKPGRHPGAFLFADQSACSSLKEIPGTPRTAHGRPMATLMALLQSRTLHTARLRASCLESGHVAMQAGLRGKSAKDEKKTRISPVQIQTAKSGTLVRNTNRTLQEAEKVVLRRRSRRICGQGPPDLETQVVWPKWFRTNWI